MSYFDPNALAQAHGYQHGHIVGEREGFRQGQEQGYDAGHADGYQHGHALGYDKGWNDAVQVANGEMSKQIQFTKQHLSEKNLLQEQLTDRQRIIRQFADKLDEVERENDELKKLIHSLRQTVQRLVVARK